MKYLLCNKKKKVKHAYLTLHSKRLVMNSAHFLLLQLKGTAFLIYKIDLSKWTI